LAVSKLNVYCAPAAKVPPMAVTLKDPEAPLRIVAVVIGVKVAVFESIVALCIVMVFDPVFWTVSVTLVLLVNTAFVIDPCSAFPMNPRVSPPIHAATTTLTATVTAMSMIEAITGLRAFAFFLNFL